MPDSSVPPPPPPGRPSDSSSSAAPLPTPEGTGLPPNIAASLACLFSIVGGIIFLVLEKKDQFVRFYAMQSTILGGLWIVVSIAFGIVLSIVGTIPVIGFLIARVEWLAGLAFFVVTILTIVKAFTGKEWEIPYLGKIARQQLAVGAAKAPAEEPPLAPPVGRSDVPPGAL